MTKVSIIIPVYNVEKYLKKCLDSVVNQTLKDIEIIIINDGSTDNSQNIINRYQKKYKNIVAVKNPNNGVGYTRNMGISLAKANYIMFLDSDDILELNAVEKMYSLIKKEDSDVVVTDINKIINDKKVLFKNYLNYSEYDNINFMLSHPGVVSKLYKKEIFTKNNINFKEKTYYEDLATTPIIAIYLNKISYLDEPLYNYLIHENSIMKQSVFTSKIDNIFDVIEFIETQFNNRVEDKYNDELEYLYIEHLLYSASLRYLNYDIYKEKINKIVKIINNKYPNWNKNKYLKKKSWKFKIICKLVYNKKFLLLKIIKKIK